MTEVATCRRAYHIAKIHAFAAGSINWGPRRRGKRVILIDLRVSLTVFSSVEPVCTRPHDEQMNYYYRADKVSLHVRKSNQGAIRLYEEFLGYKVAGVASSYYSDGEDAFVMEARLPDVNAKVRVDNKSGCRCLTKACESKRTLRRFVSFKNYQCCFLSKILLCGRTADGQPRCRW